MSLSNLTQSQRHGMSELFRKIAPVADELGELFAARGYQIALVGGSVRDVFLGRIGNDLDLTTDARPETVLELVRDWADSIWTIGIDFGTVGVRKGGWLLEITTYRSESYDPKSRKPDVAYGDTLEGDLARRDFAVNAMALRLPSREFVDPHGGLDDLHAKVLRTPGPPERSFGDDPLRMLRAARFASQLGFAVDPAALAAMGAMADRIDIVSAERIREELDKLIGGDHPREGLRLLVESGLADHVLPEVPKLRLEIDEHHRHKDVYEHSLIVLEQAIDLEESGPDRILRWAALLHDVGKPKTRRHEPGGRVSFHHHEVVGAQLARKRMAELKFPKDVVADVSRLVELHLRFHGYGTGEWTDSAVRRYVRDAGHLLEAPAQADPRRLHHPQPAQGPGPVADLRPAGGAHRPAGRGGGARQDPPRARRQRDPGAPRRPAGSPRGPRLQVPAGDAPRPGCPRQGGRLGRPPRVGTGERGGRGGRGDRSHRRCERCERCRWHRWHRWHRW
ncbi:hypothetical protein GCM10018952_14760 [Streptosporangium vulgare]